MFKTAVKLGLKDSYHADYRQQEKHLNDLTKFLSGEKVFKSDIPNDDKFCRMGRHNPGPQNQFAFFPIDVGNLNENKIIHTFEGTCFSNVSMSFELADVSKFQFKVKVTALNPKSRLCSEGFLFSNNATSWFKDVFFHGTHEYTITANNQNDFEIIKDQGLNVFMFCESFKDEIISLYTTIRAFFGGMGMHGKIQPWQPKVPDYMTNAAVKFMKWALQWELKERKTKYVTIDKNLIHSGDFIAVLRLDGKGPM